MRKLLFLSVAIIGSLILLSCGSTDSTTNYQVSISASPSEGGTVSPSSGQYEERTSLDISATPSEEYRFVEWQGDYQGTNSSATITVDSDKNIQAIFAKKEYALTINTEGEGTVDESILQTTSTTDYESGTIVELTANPTEGWRFNNWEGDIEGNQNPEQIAIDEEKSVTAVFEEGGYVSHGYVGGITPTSEERFAERTYPTIRANWEGVGGDKLWTKWNLGATAAPENATDQDPEKRGWVFQFNRKQGYHYDGEFDESNRIPQTEWEDVWGEDSNWQLANDPCRQLFGSTWRLPTLQEWDAFYNAYKSGTFNPDIYKDDAFESPLKLHSPFPGRGFWGVNGQVGAYWSGTQFGDFEARYLRIPSSGDVASITKDRAQLVRCIKN